jgi:hypothetical protein
MTWRSWSRGAGRSRVRAPDGVMGWVRHGDVVKLRWVRRRGDGFTVPLYRHATGAATLFDRLLVDPGMVVTPGAPLSRVRTRDGTGWVAKADLGPTSLLEVYVIDVGQGDGVLIGIPDGRHLRIDGAYTRSTQPTGASAADVVAWRSFNVLCKVGRENRNSSWHT